MTIEQMFNNLQVLSSNTAAAVGKPTLKTKK
jgi:hypothetical protein